MPTPPPATDATSVGEESEREHIEADRRAKADVIIPVSELLSTARNIQEVLDTGDDDTDPKDLLRNLLTAVFKATGAAGLGEVATLGTRTTFDPTRHDLLGEPPAGHDGRVQVLRPGQQWNHGGEHLVIRTATVVPYDDVHGAYLVGTPASLDEEGGERIWLDEEHDAVPECYTGPGWYVVEAVDDCDQTYEQCPNGGHCDGAWIYLYDTNPDECEAVHYASDAIVLLDCN
ncbi:MAG TPA: hypothetical protein VJT31_34940 [Rugosimonospora sp.]|nr:hypothetical protein [Rugosimonospora sp.]